ncbi:hypothetical protein PAPHI01_2063 [Pancytospora philotis]|nr:hypothetical protein PAPHI01_2063 [Pancytospora philotis]
MAEWRGPVRWWLLISSLLARIMILDDLGLMHNAKAGRAASPAAAQRAPAGRYKGGSPAPVQRPAGPSSAAPAHRYLSGANGRPQPLGTRPQQPAPSPTYSPRAPSYSAPQPAEQYSGAPLIPAGHVHIEHHVQPHYHPGRVVLLPAEPDDAPPAPLPNASPKQPARALKKAPPATKRARTKTVTKTTVSYVSAANSSAVSVTTVYASSSPAASSAVFSTPVVSVPSSVAPAPPPVSTQPIPPPPSVPADALSSLENTHNSSIESAEAAKNAFLAMKIDEARLLSDRSELKLDQLKKLEKAYEERADEVLSEMAGARTELATQRMLLKSTADSIAKLQEEMKEGDAEKRLDEMEALRLKEQLNALKDRLERSREKRQLHSSRLKQLESTKRTSNAKTHADENKLEMYKNLAAQLQDSLAPVHKYIEELERQSADEADTLNKLKIERNRYEADAHAPLFVRYT